MKKRMLSLLMSLVMVFSLVAGALPAHAETSSTAPVFSMKLYKGTGETKVEVSNNTPVCIDDTLTLEIYLDATKVTGGLYAASGIVTQNDVNIVTANNGSIAATSGLPLTYQSAAAAAGDGVVTLGGNFLFETGSMTSLFRGSRLLATYTFLAESAAENIQFGFSSLECAIDDGSTTLVEALSSGVSVSVAGKTVTLAPKTTSAVVSATYGDSWADVAKNVADAYTATCGDQTVAGSWAYAGTSSANGPQVSDASAAFLFTPDDSRYAPATVDVKLAVSPITIENISLSVAPVTKVYDGNTALVPGSLTAASTDIRSGDDVTITPTGGSIQFAFVDAGKDITLSASGYTFALAGDDAANYQLAAEPTVTLSPSKGSITKASANATVTPGARSYNSSEPNKSYPLTDSEIAAQAGETKLTLGTDFAVSYTDENGNPLDDTQLVGSADADTVYRYTLTSDNYDFGQSASGSFTVTKLPAATATGKLQAQNLFGNDLCLNYGQTFAFDTSGITVTGDNGTVSVRYLVDGAWTETAPTNVGNYQVAAWLISDGSHASGLLAGVPQVTLKIFPLDLSGVDTTISLESGPTPVYTGKAITPAVSEVTRNGSTIPKDSYTVTYENNVNAGTATVTVTGKGNYGGSKQTTFPIDPHPLTGNDVSLSARLTYNGAAQEPVPTVKIGDTTLAAGNYTVTYENNVNAGIGTATVIVTGQGNCKGRVEKKFTISPRAVTADSFRLAQTICFYNGSELTPAVQVNENAGLHAPGSGGLPDFTVSYRDNTQPGSAAAIVSFGEGTSGNYTTAGGNPIELAFQIVEVKTARTSYPLSLYGGAPLKTIGFADIPNLTGEALSWKDGEAHLPKSLPSTPPSYEAILTTEAGSQTVMITVPLTDAAPAPETLASDLVHILTESSPADSSALYSAIRTVVGSVGTSKDQDAYKQANLSDSTLLTKLDALSVATVYTTKAPGNTLNYEFSLGTGRKAASGLISGDVRYTAQQKPTPAGALLCLDLSMTLNGSSTPTQLATPVEIILTLNNSDLSPSGTFTVTGSHDTGANAFTTRTTASAVRSGSDIKLSFLATSFSEFTITYAPPASGSSATPTPTPAPEQPAATPTPALTQQEQTWLNVYGSLLNAKSGETVKADVSATDYLPGYIITAVEKAGANLALTTPAGSFTLTPAMAKTMNGSYNYTFADAMALVPKPTPAPRPTATPAPVKDPTAPTPTPTPEATASPEAAPTEAPSEAPAEEESQPSPLPLVAAGVLLAAGIAGAVLLRGRKKRSRTYKAGK